jgi:phage/plasmid-like protein (TIGR03299 family)
MSHELTIRADSTVEMAYVGEKPWHGLGQQLTPNTSIEQWQVAAGMDWKIQRSKVRYFADAQGAQQFEMPSSHVLFRSDSKAPLGIVSPEYKIVQPRAVLEFFRDLVEGNGYTLDTAGTLFGGRKFWALAKVDEANIVGADRVGGFLLLSTSCDGSMATEARETTVRVVCNNTLSMARYAKADTKMSHRQRFDPDAMKARLGLSREHFEKMVEDMRALSAKRVTNATAEAFVRELLRPTVKPAEVSDFSSFMAKVTAVEDTQRAPKGEDAILALFRGSALGADLPGVRGTAWGLVNATTAYVDHVKTAKSVDHRLDSAFFGVGDDLKTRAFDLAFAI